MAAGTKSDGVGLAAMVAIGRSAGCDFAAAKAKLHKFLSKSASF